MKVLIEFLRLKVKEVFPYVAGVSIVLATAFGIVGIIYLWEWVFKNDLLCWIILVVCVGCPILWFLFIATRGFFRWIRSNWRQAKENVRNRG